MSDRVGIFYGWKVVAAVCAMLTMSSGLGFYAQSVLLNALTAERGLPVDLASSATTFFFLVMGVSGLAVGGLIGRYDPRYTICPSAVLAALGLYMAGQVTEVWELYVAYFVFGVGFSGSGLVPGTTLVARWFARRRPFALAVASTGMSLGGIALTPLLAQLIAARGLSEATAWMAGLYVIGVVPMVVLFVRPSPQSMGLEMDGDPVRDDGPPTHTRGVRYAEAVRSRFFMGTIGAFIFIFMAQTGAMAHQFKLLADRVDVNMASMSIAALATASLIGRFAGGWALGYMSTTRLIYLLVAAQAAALLYLSIGQGTVALLVGCAALGITVGNLLMLLPLLLAEAFGVREYGRIYSVSQLITVMGVAGGPVFAGFIYTWFGGYTAAFTALAGLEIIAVLLLFFAGSVEPMKRRAQSAA